MVNIPSAEEIDKRFKDGASRAPARYADGINRTNNWNQNASSPEAESNYAAKVQEAISQGKRQKAVAQVSDSDWKAASIKKGGRNIGPGMLDASEKRKRNYEPIRSALASLTLPPKGPDPFSNIDTRLKKVVETEIEASKARLGI